VISSPPSVDLRQLHTFGLPAKAVRVETFVDVETLQNLLRETPTPHLILGDGSNVAFVDDYPGTILLNRITGRKVLERGHGGKAEVLVGAGEEWHNLVLWSLEQKLYGLENLSLIPGRVGAAPIQNIGAYGVELSDVFKGCRVYDRQSEEATWLSLETCDFGYRNSIFKTDRERYVILEIKLELDTKFSPKLDYGDLAERAAALEKELDGPALSALVCEIRSEKIPHPCDLGNAGSFFKNPVIDAQLKNQLQALGSSPPLYDLGNGSFKTSAAWLIDQCGLKGAREGDIAVHKRQPLVLVNHGNGTGRQLLSLTKRVQETVFERFNVRLEREVNLVPPPQGRSA